jgi:carbamoyltransferase
VQEVCEEAMLRMARTAHRLTGMDRLCLAGGVALNCVGNGRILREGPFEEIWIQPAAGDAGGALGAALAVHYREDGPAGERPRRVPRAGDAMKGALLGPEFTAAQIREYLDAEGIAYEELPDAEWADTIAGLVARGAVVGLLQGRMEFGPRALGCRSILGDARSPEMQSRMNLKIKFRESFRPFAPSVLAERAADYFELDRPSPYMLLVADVREERRLPAAAGGAEAPAELGIRERVNRPRSDVPAVTHVDYSARVQTVHRETNEPYWRILVALERRTGCAVAVNTSFNVRGEPIVCTPGDAYRCFMRTGMDHLILGPFLLRKSDQPEWREPHEWREDLQLD